MVLADTGIVVLVVALFVLGIFGFMVMGVMLLWRLLGWLLRGIVGAGRTRQRTAVSTRGYDTARHPCPLPGCSHANRPGASYCGGCGRLIGGTDEVDAYG